MPGVRGRAATAPACTVWACGQMASRAALSTAYAALAGEPSPCAVGGPVVSQQPPLPVLGPPHDVGPSSCSLRMARWPLSRSSVFRPPPNPRALGGLHPLPLLVPTLPKATGGVGVSTSVAPQAGEDAGGEHSVKVGEGSSVLTHRTEPGERTGWRDGDGGGRASPPGASGLFMRTQGVTRFGMPALGPGFAGVPRAPGLTLPPAGGLPSDWRPPSLRRLAAEARFRFPGLLRPGRVASLLDGNKATLPLGDMEIASPFGSSLRRPARRSEMGRWLGGDRLAGGGSLGVALPRRWGRAPAADSAAPPAGPPLAGSAFTLCRRSRRGASKKI